MRRVMLLGVLLLGAAPQDPAAPIERLRAEDPATRERARRELEKLGSAAESVLQKYAGDPDPEVAHACRRLLTIIELDRAFSPALKKAEPDIVRRLAASTGEDWTEIYLRLTSQPEKKLSRSDLEPLAGPAVRHASPDERKDVLKRVGQWFHRSAEPEVLRLLDACDRYGEGREIYSCLEALRGVDADRLVIQALGADPERLLSVANENSIHDAAPTVVEWMHHSDPKVAETAIGLAQRWAIPASLNRAAALLDHPNLKVRREAMRLLCALSRDGESREILRLLADPQEDVRDAAASEAWTLDLKLSPEHVRAMRRDSSWFVRQIALEWQAAKAPPGEALPWIRAALKDPAYRVRESAVELLGRFGGPSDAALLAPFLQSRTADVRNGALHSLSRLDPDRARSVFQEILGDPQKWVEARTDALQSLVALGSTPKVEELQALVLEAPEGLAIDAFQLLVERHPGRLGAAHIDRLLKEVSGSRFEWVARLLTLENAETSIDALVRACGNREQAGEAAQALMVLGKSRNVRILRPFLAGDDPELKKLAVRWLGRWRAQEARDEILACLGHEDPDLQRLAVEALKLLGRGPGEEALRTLASGDEETLRRAAREALKEFGVHPPVEELRKELEASHSKEAAEALYDLRDPHLVPALIRWLESGSQVRVSDACDFLSMLKSPEAVPALVALLDHPDGSLRREGLWTLRKCGARDQARRLLPLLHEPGLGSSVIEAFAEWKSVEVIPDLRALLTNADPNIRRLAITGLGRLGAADALPELRGFLADSRAPLRLEAADAVGRLRDAESLDALIGLAWDPSPRVRRAAVEALVNLDERGMAAALPALLDNPEGWEPQLVHVLELGGAPFRKEVLDRSLDPAAPGRDRLLWLLAVVKCREIVPELLRRVNGDEIEDWNLRALADFQVTEAGPLLKKKLEEHPYGKDLEIVETLARLGDSGPLEAWLAGRDPRLRYRAARHLCRQGDMRGAALILEWADMGESEHSGYRGCCNRDWWSDWLRNSVRPSLSLLNAIRNPAAWKKLVSSRWRIADSFRRVDEAVGEIAAAAGLDLRWDRATTYDQEKERRGWVWRSDRVGEDLAETLEGCLESQGEWGYLLDGDCIRMVPRLELLRFWKEWGAGELAKLKK